MKRTGTLIVLLTFLSCVSLIVLLTAPASVAQQPPAETDVSSAADSEMIADSEKGSFWMEQKLRLSKDLLTGLANGDFETIGKSAQIMRGLNRVEKFVRRGPEGYRDHLRQFNMANQALVDAATEENLEAATLAFNQMTISCVNCHKHLRAAQ